MERNLVLLATIREDFLLDTCCGAQSNDARHAVSLRFCCFQVCATYESLSAESLKGAAGLHLSICPGDSVIAYAAFSSASSPSPSPSSAMRVERLMGMISCEYEMRLDKL